MPSDSNVSNETSIRIDLEEVLADVADYRTLRKRVQEVADVEWSEKANELLNKVERLSVVGTQWGIPCRQLRSFRDRKAISAAGWLSRPPQPMSPGTLADEEVASIEREAKKRITNAAKLPGDTGPAASNASDAEPMPKSNGDKYELGPGRSVKRGQRAELSMQEFRIFQAINYRESVPIGDLMRPSYDDAVWKERYNQDDPAKNEKIRKAISRLNNKLLTASVTISLSVSPPDLIVTYR